MWDKPWPKLEMSTYRERTPMLGVFLLPLATERHLPGSFLARGGEGGLPLLAVIFGLPNFLCWLGTAGKHGGHVLSVPGGAVCLEEPPVLRLASESCPRGERGLNHCN